MNTEELSFEGWDKHSNICTTTSILVTEINENEYGEQLNESEVSSFKNQEVKYYAVQENITGLSRYFGAKSQREGRYICNRIFKENENPIEYLDLKSTENSGERACLVNLPKGTRIAVGDINQGKGMQARISGLDLSKVEYRDLQK